jgi:hypothetical protein
LHRKALTSSGERQLSSWDSGPRRTMVAAMPSSLNRKVWIVLLAAVIAGCAHPGPDAKQPRAKAAVERKKAPNLGKQRLMLSEGYSLLYQDASNLDLSDLILYVKAESESMHAFITDTADVGGQLKKNLERIAKDYPGVRIDLDPLPEMEKRKRRAISKDRARYFAPIVGKGGREYERTVLIAFANGLNHERHLCEVMAEAEPDASLQKFLRDAGKRYDALYERVNDLLEKEYFRAPDARTKE